MTRSLPAAVALCLLLPAALWAETTAAQDAITRPDDPDGEKKMSDGLAECASILAVASTLSKNIVERNNMSNASASWFATSGDVASEEGKLPSAKLWEIKVANWAGQIGSVDALGQNTEWMAYCADIGNKHSLDTQFFPASE